MSTIFMKDQKNLKLEKEVKNEMGIDAVLATLAMGLIVSAVFLLLLVAVEFGNSGPNEIIHALQEIRKQ